jgi:hypothetical protein
MTTTMAGLIAISIPLLATALLFARWTPPLVLFFLALSAVAVGYLHVEGVVDDIGAIVLEKAGLKEPAPRGAKAAPSQSL